MSFDKKFLSMKDTNGKIVFSFEFKYTFKNLNNIVDNIWK